MPRAGVANIHTGIDATELRAFRRHVKDLKPDSPQYARRLGAAYKAGSDVIVAEAQSRARALGGIHAKAADAIKASASTTGISVRIAATAGSPYGLLAFWGATRHSGWYAANRYRDSPPQHPPWVGNTWQVGEPGEGPYAINDAIAATIDDVMNNWADAIEALMNEIPTEE
jgi:hypothetical protein